MVYGLDYTPSLLESLVSVPNTNDASKVPSASAALDSDPAATKANLVDLGKPEASNHKEDASRIRRTMSSSHSFMGWKERMTLRTLSLPMPNAVVNAQADSDVGAGAQQEGGAINATTTTHQLLRPKVPQYRGLVWVVCEEDLKDDRVALSILRRKPLPTSSTNSEFK
ncbi:hypothetical protein BKA70DRAFT_1218396 [Coprinopsis sp. MPI-PUGE-AT-0042]|nr:hypothetical protein BKA70DRAFT_1218396 [Coprinopsis sp. MPI-PUGE-AT-0042]